MLALDKLNVLHLNSYYPMHSTVPLPNMILDSPRPPLPFSPIQAHTAPYKAPLMPLLHRMPQSVLQAHADTMSLAAHRILELVVS